MRYYRPTPEELLNNKEFICEVYDAEENSWTSFTYDSTVHMEIPLDDLRVKYLDSRDFNSLGVSTKKIFLGKRTQIKDILPDGTEVEEEIDVWYEETLTLIKGGKAIGFFYPFKPAENVDLAGKKFTVKNLTELKKII